MGMGRTRNPTDFVEESAEETASVGVNRLDINEKLTPVPEETIHKVQKIAVSVDKLTSEISSATVDEAYDAIQLGFQEHNMVYNMREAALISQATFSFNLDSANSASFIDFGLPDYGAKRSPSGDEDHTFELAISDPTTMVNYTPWVSSDPVTGIAFSSVGVNPITYEAIPLGSAYPVNFNPAKAKLGVPIDLTLEFAALMDDRISSQYMTTDGYDLFLPPGPCDFDQYPSLFFRIGAYYLEVKPEDYLEEDLTTCSLMIESTSENNWVFGYHMLDQYYVTFMHEVDSVTVAPNLSSEKMAIGTHTDWPVGWNVFCSPICEWDWYGHKPASAYTDEEISELINTLDPEDIPIAAKEQLFDTTFEDPEGTVYWELGPIGDSFIDLTKNLPVAMRDALLSGAKVIGTLYENFANILNMEP
mmetsp:Transcript_14703/g.22787  ORF Transcript_14703/g.22787 Transcript_14703/m.22787 type:complete len:418 (-) Transcript_14703:20-1273(-)